MTGGSSGACGSLGFGRFPTQPGAETRRCWTRQRAQRLASLSAVPITDELASYYAACRSRSTTQSTSRRLTCLDSGRATRPSRREEGPSGAPSSCLLSCASMRIVALLAVHDEERFIGGCIEHLAGQGVEAYLLDNDSTDGTVEIAERHLGHGLIGIEASRGTGLSLAPDSRPQVRPRRRARRRLVHPRRR